MVAAVRARGIHRAAVCPARNLTTTDRAWPTLSLPPRGWCAACAQVGRVLSVAVAPGRHPLRALATADGAPPSLAPAWAEVGTAADPVWARSMALTAIATEWQWTALPADYAGVIAASGLLPQIARVVVLGGAYVASLRGGCATPLPWRGAAMCRAI